MVQDTMPKQTTVQVVNTHKLDRILLADTEWHNVEDAELVPISVGSSPSSDPEYALKFKENGIEMFIPKRAILGYQGQFNQEDSSESTGYSRR